MRLRDRPGRISERMERSVRTSLGIMSRSAVALSCGKKEYLNNEPHLPLHISAYFTPSLACFLPKGQGIQADVDRDHSHHVDKQLGV